MSTPINASHLSSTGNFQANPSARPTYVLLPSGQLVSIDSLALSHQAPAKKPSLLKRLFKYTAIATLTAGSVFVGGLAFKNHISKELLGKISGFIPNIIKAPLSQIAESAPGKAISELGQMAIGTASRWFQGIKNTVGGFLGFGSATTKVAQSTAATSKVASSTATNATAAATEVPTVSSGWFQSIKNTVGGFFGFGKKAETP